jgi:hypothetical protein
MFKFDGRAAALMAALVLLHGAALAGASNATPTNPTDPVPADRRAPTEAWAGKWYDNTGGLMALTVRDGLIDLYGTDRASIYRGLCIVDPPNGSAATCSGEGVNHERGLRFAYRSQLHLLANGGIEERWEALGPGMRLEGKARFQRQAPAGVR